MLWHVQLHHQMPPLYWGSTLPVPQRVRDLRRKWRAQPGPSAVELAVPYPTFLHPELAQRFQLRQRYANLWLQATAGGHQRGMATAPFWSNLFAYADPGFIGIPVKHRYPFFDLRLVCSLLALPRVPWCLNKTLLRVAMQERLPVSVLRQPKMYAASLPELMPHREAPAWMLSLANEPALEPYVESAQLRELIQGLTQLTGGEYRCTLQALALAYWLRYWRRPRASNSVRTVPCRTAAVQ
jgi:asparagine synthase (glutamine-hydrolysing)